MQIKQGADNLLGFDVDTFNIGAQRFMSESGGFTMGMNRFIENQEYAIGMQQKEFDRANSFKSREAAEAARKDRKEERTTNIFQDIADGIKGLAKGAVNATKAGGGFLDFLKKGALIGLLFLLPKTIHFKAAASTRDCPHLLKDKTKYLQEAILDRYSLTSDFLSIKL